MEILEVRVRVFITMTELDRPFIIDILMCVKIYQSLMF